MYLMGHFVDRVKQMEIFGIIGMSLGLMGFVFGLIAVGKVDKIEKKLKELKVLNEDFKSE